MFIKDISISVRKVADNDLPNVSSKLSDNNHYITIYASNNNSRVFHVKKDKLKFYQVKKDKLKSYQEIFLLDYEYQKDFYIVDDDGKEHHINDIGTVCIDSFYIPRANRSIINNFLEKSDKDILIDAINMLNKNPKIISKIVSNHNKKIKSFISSAYDEHNQISTKKPINITIANYFSSFVSADSSIQKSSVRLRYSFHTISRLSFLKNPSMNISELYFYYTNLALHIKVNLKIDDQKKSNSTENLFNEVVNYFTLNAMDCSSVSEE